MVDRGASDLHLCCKHGPVFRIDGHVEEDKSSDPIDADELFRMLFSITPQRNREQFLETHDTDFAYAIPEVSRYRANLFFDRYGPGAVFRAVPNDIIPANTLGLTKEVQQLATLTKGLVLVTGPTGSGKSTTLAAILDLVNQQRSDHIITIEDPVEFVHPTKKCLVNQREVGVHTSSFRAALRAALREDPDVVLVGELRDLETVEMAIETAETGHLVFGTLHTTTASSTVDRIIDQFPADRQSQIRVMLSESLRAVIAQTLLPKTGGGRVAAHEILIVNPSISNLIREGKTFEYGTARAGPGGHGDRAGCVDESDRPPEPEGNVRAQRCRHELVGRLARRLSGSRGRSGTRPGEREAVGSDAGPGGYLLFLRPVSSSPCARRARCTGDLFPGDRRRRRG
jgi:twitching motility protein PilT